MKNRKVYTAPSAELLLLAPAETLAANSQWGYGSWNGLWKNQGTFSQGKASGVGIVNGGLNESTWADDGYTLK